VPRRGFRVGVPFPGRWTELANSDATEYGGSGLGNLGGVEAAGSPAHGRPHSLDITLPPLAAVFFKGVRPPEAAQLEEGIRNSEFGIRNEEQAAPSVEPMESAREAPARRKKRAIRKSEIRIRKSEIDP
jgi:hypothetical protein